MAKPTGKDYAERHDKDDGGDPGGDKSPAERAAAIRARDSDPRRKDEGQKQPESGQKAEDWSKDGGKDPVKAENQPVGPQTNPPAAVGSSSTVESHGIGVDPDQKSDFSPNRGQSDLKPVVGDSTARRFVGDKERIPAGSGTNPQNPQNLPRHGDGSGEERAKALADARAKQIEEERSTRPGDLADRIDPQGGRTVGGASRQPVGSSGPIAGTDGDARERAERAIAAENRRNSLGPAGDIQRREDQAIDASNRTAEADLPTVMAAEARKVAIDRLEAEIDRHDKAYNDVSAGLIFSTPPLNTQQLHDLRLAALTVLNRPNSSPEMMDAESDRLAQVTFTNPAAPGESALNRDARSS